MYGIEATTGLGGLAATAPAGYAALSRTLAIRPMASALAGGPPQSGTVLPADGPVNTQTALPIVSAGGSSVEHDPGLIVDDWRQILDWHNSPAPWILAGILLLYTWQHVSVRASRR